jgi:ornithine carbamoyltransferase
MRGRDLLAIADLQPGELEQILQAAIALKRDGSGPLLAGRAAALLFEKPSLRTRVSFEVGVAQLGGRCIYLSPQEIGLGQREPVRDVARVLGRYVDVLVVRTASQETLAELAHWADIPVINALSDHEHPCQALADMLTILEARGRFEGVKVAYVGDGNNVARSLLFACAQLGASLAMASPPGYELPQKDLEQARAMATGTATMNCKASPTEAVAAADVVYTDVWTSMGQETDAGSRREAFVGFTVDRSLLARAAPGAIVMHDLPAHRGEEISDDVIESAQSVVFLQAENRLHAQKAVLALILEANTG